VAQPIVTPEAVVIDLERANVASRTLAMVIDVLALAATWGVLALVVLLALGDSDLGPPLWYALASLLLVFLWFPGFETLWGRTPGKAALGLRVVSADGTPVRFQQAFLRAVVGLVDFLLVPVGVIAVVSVMLSSREQRLGDLAAGTLVVRERSAHPDVAAVWFRPPPGYEAYAGSLDVAALDAEAYELIRSYLMRAGELTPGARDHLAVRIANPVAVRMQHMPPRQLHPYAFLICVAAAWQRSHGVPPQPAVATPPGYPPPPGGVPPHVPPAPGAVPPLRSDFS
jgi:uncharacterized RDD family membrane protein YckC